MNNIPKKLRVEFSLDPYYRHCARAGILGHTCAGRITWEHACYFGGKQIQKRWAIIPICEKGHGVGIWQDRGDMQKEIHEWIALSRATDEELLEISKATDQFKRRAYLTRKYGVYDEAYIVSTLDVGVGINY